MHLCTLRATSTHTRPTMRLRRAARACRLSALVFVMGASLAGCAVSGDADTSAGPPQHATATLGPLPIAAPPLPFADNPDPTLCGVPRAWLDDEPAWVAGLYAGELVQPVVYLYDSHLRNEVIGQIPHGGRVEIELSQSNPELDFYRVRSLDMQPVQEGWLPAPFLSFEPVR